MNLIKFGQVLSFSFMCYFADFLLLKLVDNRFTIQILKKLKILSQKQKTS